MNHRVGPRRTPKLACFSWRQLAPYLLALLSLPGAQGEAKAAESPSHGEARATAVGSQLEGPLGRALVVLKHEYSRQGRVTLLRPELLGRGQDVPLLVPAHTDGAHACISLIVLSATNISFALRFETGPGKPPQRAWPVPSVAGLSEVTRCGQRAALMAHAHVTMRSKKGVIQGLVVESDSPITSATHHLPHRRPGQLHPSPDVDPPPTQGPLRVRAARYQEMARALGAERSSATEAKADERGRLMTPLTLSAGCHQLRILGADRPKRGSDIDALLFAAKSGELLLRDDSNAGDGALDVCVGQDQGVWLGCRGNAPGAELTVVHSSWPLPEAIPREWGPIAQGHMAEALRAARVIPFEGRPVYSSVGVRGVTRQAVEVTPGSCYQVAVAGFQGTERPLALALSIGAQRVSGQPGFAALPLGQPRTGQLSSGAALTFCAEEERRARIEVKAEGHDDLWLLSVWQLGPRTEPPSEALK